MARDTPSSSHLIFAADGHLVSFFGPAFFTRDSHEEKDSMIEAKTQTEAQSTKLAETFVQLHVSPPKAPSRKAAAKAKWNSSESRKAKLHNVHTPRQVLRQLLLEQVRPEIIHWGNRLNTTHNTQQLTTHCEVSGRKLQSTVPHQAGRSWTRPFHPDTEPSPRARLEASKASRHFDV